MITLTGIKKIALLAFTLSIVFFSHTHAATLTATASGTTINATLSGVTNLSDSYKLVAQTAPFGNSAYTGTVSNIAGDPTIATPVAPTAGSVTSSVTWAATGYVPNTTYYLQVVDIPGGTATPFYVPGASATVTIPQATIYFNHLTVSKSGSNIELQGSINTVKQPNYLSFKVYLKYSTSADLSNPVQSNEQSFPTDQFGANPGISDGSALSYPAGNYYWVLSNLKPNTTYYAQQTIVGPNNQSIVDNPITFNSDTGAIIPPTTSNPNDIISGTNTNLNNSDYTLLAPFPGLTDIPSANTCAQREAAATAAGTAQPVCDINGLLNYAMKLLIGLSGVVLVLRLMYEGYVYMVTDVPFLKASSKAGFFSALLGLLLALTSFIILNTINPKLVNESVNVGQLSIGVDQTSIDTTTFQKLTGQVLGNESSYETLVNTLSQQQGIDSCIVKATIQVESGWNAAAIGCDENSPYPNVPSRMAYLGSGINFDGSTFTPTNVASSSQKNNGCTFNATAPGYGLDWRFSKGGGLMQVTIAPQGYKSQAWYSGVGANGSYYTNRNKPYQGWQTLIDPTTNITRGIGILKEGLAACGGSIDGTFRYYQSGSNCSASGTLIDATVAKKMAAYNSCKGQ